MTVPALECSRISKVFGGLRAINDVSLTVPSGSLCALIGPNGAGKTTLFNVATNLFSPSSGEVRFFGQSAARLALHEIAALGVVRTFQTARIFPGMTAFENVMAGAHLHLRASFITQMLWTRDRRAAKSVGTPKKPTSCSKSPDWHVFAKRPPLNCRSAHKSWLKFCGRLWPSQGFCFSMSPRPD